MRIAGVERQTGPRLQRGIVGAPGALVAVPERQCLRCR